MPGQQTEQQRQATFQATGQQPAAQAPVTPAPQMNTPAAPVTVNVNGTAPVSTATPQPNTTAQGTPQVAAAPTTALTQPGTGSVVDLLNSAGQDSSFANRQQLAQQYGIQGYTGTAAQNQELSKKYTDAFNANKGSPVPQSGAQARSAMGTYFESTPQQAEADPQKTFFDSYMQMNPVVKSLYDQVNQELSTPVTSQTFQEQYNELLNQQGIPALNTELMNIKNIMDGTEDDIRDEITKAGGFATESQVQALTGARNKTLLKQANVLAQQIALKDDYIDQVMQFSELDRAQVEKDIDRKLGLTEKLATIQESITNAAKDNYQKVVDAVGYQGLADSLGGDVQAQKMAERSLGLPPGALTNAAFLKASSGPKGSMSGSIQEYEYAKSQGYGGSFIDYQNEDANRKRSIASAGVGGMGFTPAQINSTVNGIAGAFDNEPIVKNYNTVQEGYKTIENIGVNTSSPTDDIAFIYAFAKIMDPNSVVREGEYNTIQKYAQTWADNFGFKAQRLYSNTNFLSPDAKQKMLNTLKPKVDTITNQYNNLQSEYQRQVNDAYQGKPRQITNYSASTPQYSGKTVTVGNSTYTVGDDGETLIPVGGIDFTAITVKK